MNKVNAIAKVCVRCESASDAEVDLSLFVAELQEHCAFLADILQVMVSSTTSHNATLNPTWKLQCGSWMLDLLTYVHSQHSSHIATFITMAMAAQGSSSSQL